MTADHTSIPTGASRDVLDATGNYAFRIVRNPKRATEWEVFLTDGPGAAGDEHSISAGDLDETIEGFKRLVEAAHRTLAVLEAQKTKEA